MNFILCYVVVACTIMNINRKGGSVAYSRTLDTFEQKNAPSMETCMQHIRHNIPQLCMENDMKTIIAKKNKYHEFLLSTGCCTKLCTMVELLDKLCTKSHRKHVKVPSMKSCMKKIKYEIPEFCLKNKRQAIVTQKHEYYGFLLSTGCCTKHCTSVELLDKLCTNNTGINEKSTEPEKVIETTTTDEAGSDEEIVVYPSAGISNVQPATENSNSFLSWMSSKPLEVKPPSIYFSIRLQNTTQSTEPEKVTETTTTHEKGADEEIVVYPSAGISNVQPVTKNSTSTSSWMSSKPLGVKSPPTYFSIGLKNITQSTEHAKVIEKTTTHMEGVNEEIYKFPLSGISNIQENTKKITEISPSKHLGVKSPPTNISTGPSKITQITEQSTEPEKVIETTTTHKKGADEDL